MTYRDGIPVFGEPIENAVEQIRSVARDAQFVALMADHHLGYSMPIGGVAAYREHVSPSGVGFDIACGNKAVRLDVLAEDIRPHIAEIMDHVYSRISFGVGMKNPEPIQNASLFYDDPAWDIPAVASLRDLAREQLGTVGSGNHYVDVFHDEQDRAWVGVHFGSRGFGHKIATHYLKAGGGTDGINAEPTLLATDSDLGREYLAAMQLAGRYAYAGRDFVCSTVASIIGGTMVEEVHNHHNFAWQEEHQGERVWVVRKGATPAFPGQRGFVGGSMGETSVVLHGIDSPESRTALYSTIHGAGRVMSRTQAAGKSKWKSGRRVRVSEGRVSRDMMLEWVSSAGVELRGAGVDESPHVYKRLPEVLEAHAGTIEVEHWLTPMGVAMAAPNEFDPYKD